MSFRFEDVAEIVKVIDSSSCDELLIETAEIKLMLRRRGAAAAAPGGVGAPSAAAVAPPEPRSAGSNLRAPTRTAPPPEGEPDGVVITAPMVGMFYRSPSPDAPPYVELGSVVRRGDPLCLIEVMKLFTTIEAPCDGRVLEIGAENGALVEYNQMLFVLGPNS